ncbi:MAG: LacI family DNA-binding transcriptional regulator [Bacteroidota bacterium]|nr:LacI family DNA-binding transcriptional regulator [Bacteroidota bacterium]
MHITVRDVARHANVSISTVSRVLNDSARVNQDKKRRVMEAVKQLGYIPNPAARNLVRRETGAIGALLPHITGEFFAELLAGLDEAAQRHSKPLVVSASHRHASEFSQALRILQRRVDGLLIMAPELEAEEVLEMARPGISIVFLNTRRNSANLHTFDFDNYGGVNAMTRHIIGLGHDRLAFVGGPDEAHDAQARRRGFRDALSEKTYAMEITGDFSAKVGYEAAIRILTDAPQTTAIVAANDLSALGALRALHERGIDVPRDMMVTGFDDIPSAKFATPSLTTVHVPIQELTVQAVSHLAGLIQGDPDPVSHMEPLPLVMRESTAARKMEPNFL